MKHIESIQPEYAADDMTALLLSDATASAALSRLLQQWTGCAIPPLATTPQSEVEELVPLCLSILRRHWTTPLTALGDGTTPMSLADLLRRLIGDRVQGNEAWSIPPANANIPTAVAALTKRHIDDGLTLTLTDGGADGSTTSPTTTSLPDGLSLAQLLCSSLADTITEIKDSNVGWTMTKSLLWSIFPNVTKATLNCGESSVNLISIPVSSLSIPNLVKWESYGRNTSGISNQTSLREITLPRLKYVAGDSVYASQKQGGFIFNCSYLEQVNMPELEDIENTYSHFMVLCSCPNLKVWNAPNVQRINAEYIVYDCPLLEKVVFGTIKSGGFRNAYGLYTNNFVDSNANLIHFEIGAGTSVSLHMEWWIPTNALAERLPEFLSNFKTYIAQRLTDKGSGLTIYLSQAVRDAIQTDPEIVNIITSKGWAIDPAPSV